MSYSQKVHWLIPDLSRMVFEYCWSPPSKTQSPTTEDYFNYSCVYGNYERVSEILEVYVALKEKSLLKKGTQKDEKGERKDRTSPSAIGRIDDIINWNFGLQLACMSYLKIVELIVHHYDELSNRGIRIGAASRYEMDLWIRKHGPIFGLDWEVAWKLAKNRGTKEIANFMKKRKKMAKRERHKAKRERRDKWKEDRAVKKYAW